MAQKNNGPVIAMAIFAVLSVMLAVFLYMTVSDNRAKAIALDNSKEKESDLNGTLREKLDDIRLLNRLIGVGENVEAGSGDTDTDTANGRTKKILDELGGGDLPANDRHLIGLLQNESAENNKNSFTATDRKRQLDLKITENGQLTMSKDGEIVKHKAALAKAEEQRIKQEAIHIEELARLGEQVDTLRGSNARLEDELAALRVSSARQIEDLIEDNNDKRTAIVDLRARLRQKDDPTFSTADGHIQSVDHNRELCYIDLGRADGLREGVTFSVYTPGNSGVGRNNTSDIKGQIEVVDILADHRAEARIVKQDLGRPIAGDDPIYSPIFQTGQSLEIAVAGRIALDGLDRSQFRRLVTAAGGKITVEVGDEGQFTDGKGNPVDSADAPRQISSRTRYLIIADLGDDTENQELEQIYKLIRDNSQKLRNRAENLGIYEIGLSTFLEHIGYSRKQVKWTPEGGRSFPGRLPNGSHSAAVNSSFRQSQSSAVISGKYSGLSKSTTTSIGNNSKVFGN
ncbi:MAG: hypothetical protein GY903_19290 [Fuerstiella sp.]|nr:hypothetical protein [Fuerstiella sp.]MCP4856630.1 hypothetical protein [Fuerstiella sp.]